MKKTREQRQTELQTKATELINRLLDWTDQTDKPNLSQIEDEILSLRKELGESMLQTVVAAQEADRPSTQPTCPSCGQPLEDKGRRPHQTVTRVGEVTLHRGYYYCPYLPAGLFSPLDQQLQLEDPHLSERVSQLAVWLSGQVPFGKAEAILEKVGGRFICLPRRFGGNPKSGDKPFNKLRKPHSRKRSRWRPVPESCPERFA